MYRLYNGINPTELEPSEFSVGQNYPNPFKNKTVIKYCVAYKTKVQIIVYNSEGKLIEKLVDEEKKPGTYEVEFHYVETGHAPSLLYRLEAGDYSSEKKMVLEK